MQQYGSQTISGALRLQGTAVAGSGAATAVLLVQSTLPGQRQIAAQQVSSVQTGDLFTALDYNGNVIMKVDQNGQLRSYGIGQQVLPLGTPVITSVTNAGTAGTTTYGYRVSAVNSQGQTIASTEVTTATGNATLDVTNYNVVTWNPVAGAVAYRVYGRYVGAEAILSSVNGDGRSSAYTYNDNTVAGSATTAGLNPIPNSSLAVNTSTWLATACTLTRDVSHGFPGALSGVGSGLMTATAGDMRVETSSSANVSHQRPVGIAVGNTYTGSAYVYLGTAPVAQVNIRYYDAAGGYLASNFGSTGGSSSAWTRLTVTGVAPSNAVYATIEVECSAAAVGQTCWFTAPQIDPGGAAGTYTYDVPQAGAGTHLILQQWNGATGPITEWQQYGGATMASVGNIGQFIPSVGSVGYSSALNYFGSSVANAPVLRIEGYGNSVNGSGALVSITNRNIAGSPVQVALGGQTGILATPQAVGGIAAVFRGISGQSGNLTEWQDPTGVTTQAYVDSTGRIFSPTLFTQSVKDPTTLQGALNLATVGYVLDVTAGTGSTSRVTQRLKMASAQLADAFQLQDSTGAQVLARISNAGAGQFSSLGTPNFLLATPVISSVVTAGTAGATTYAYRVSAVNAWGETVASTEVTLTTGNATLTGTNYNTITWAAVTGATSYRVYGRYVGAESLLATVTGATTYNDQASYSVGTVAAGLNPLPNSSLNTNVTGWQVTGCTIARDTTVAPPVPGVTAGLFTSTVATGGCNTQTGNATGLRGYAGVSASTAYTASAWVYLGTMPSALIGIDWFDSAGNYLSGVSSANGGTASGWTRLTVTATSHASAAYVNVYIQGNETAIGQTMWFAAPQVDPGAVALPYVRDLPMGTGSATIGGPLTAPVLTGTTVVGSGGVYDGAARVYSTNNPPPGSTTSTSLQIASSTILPIALGTNLSQYAGYATAGYYRRADGFVDLQGTLIASATISAGATVASGLPLPADGLNHVFNVILSGSSASIIALALSATGVLTVAAGSIPASTVTIELDGISYYAGGSTSTYVAGPAMAIPTDVPHVVTPSAGWTALGGSWAVPKYITTASGMVYLQGIVVASASYGIGSGILAGLPLPADGLAHIFTAFDTVSGAASIVQLRQDGVLLNQAAVTSGHTLCLDGIVYLTTTAGNAGFASSSFATSVKFGSER